MMTGNNAQEAAEEQQRRERMREEYESGLDNVPTARQERERPDLFEYEQRQDDAVRAAGYGASGILGDL